MNKIKKNIILGEETKNKLTKLKSFQGKIKTELLLKKKLKNNLKKRNK